jgi:ABC-2 type transport system permease protein
MSVVPSRGGNWSLASAEVPRSAFRMLLRTETKLALRLPKGVLVGVLVPNLLLVIFGSLSEFHRHLKVLGGLTYLDVYFPILISFVITGLALFGLPLSLARYREKGILRRLATTPVPPAWVLAAQFVNNLVFVAIELAFMLAVGLLAFGVAVPRSPAGLLVTEALSVLALFAIGLWIAAISRTEQLAGLNALGWFFPMLFFAGLWLPRAEMPAALRYVSDLTPLGAAVDAAQSAMLRGFPPVAPLLVLAAYAVVFAALAVRFFRWE